MECIYRWKQIGDLLLIAMSDGDLSIEQIAPTNELHRTDQVTKGFALALGNPGMAPAVRKSLAAAMRDHRSYAVTESSIARGVITAMNWLGNPMKACSPDAMREALVDLGVPEGHTVEDLLSALEALKSEVEGAARRSQTG